MSRQFRAGPFAKRILLMLASLAFACLLLELLIPLGFRIARGYPFPRERTQTQLAAEAREPSEALESARTAPSGDAYVLHPYLGYTLNLDLREHDPESPLFGYTVSWLKRAPGRLVVALVGGSFASQIGVLAGDELVSGIREASGREVRLAIFGLGGYKQPQQLLTLTYLLSLGAEFDLVINVDGFNEIALPPVEMVPRGVFPLYPRNWAARTALLSDSALRQKERIQSLVRLRRGWARFFQSTPVRLSNLALTIWKSIDTRLDARIARLTLGFGHESGALPWEQSGPSVEFGDEASLLEFLADSWARCSVQMDLLCRANGSRYLHCLQPNQYVEGAKPMTAEERATALSPDQPYRQFVEKGYPLLNRYGRTLIDKGVDFHDLTRIFRDIERPLYADNCCHLTREGYRLVARKIVAILSREGYFRTFPMAEGTGSDHR